MELSQKSLTGIQKLFLFLVSMNIQKDWKAKLESAYSFMLKYSKIIVCNNASTVITCTQRIKARKRKETIKTRQKVRFFFSSAMFYCFLCGGCLAVWPYLPLVSIFEWSFSWSLDCQATKKAINISRGHGSWPFSTSIASIQKLLKYRTVGVPCVLYCPWTPLSSSEYMYYHTTAHGLLNRWKDIFIFPRPY